MVTPRPLLACLIGALLSYPIPALAASPQQEAFAVPANLATLGFFSWIIVRAAQEDSAPEEADLPNYNLTPTAHESILLDKLADLHPEFIVPRGIKTTSRRAADAFLRRVRSGDTSKLGPFGSELLAYLDVQRVKRNSSPLFPYFEGGPEASTIHARSPSRPIQGTTGILNPMFDNMEGRFTDDGILTTTGAHARGGLPGGFAYELQPLFLLSSQTTPTQPSSRLTWQRAYGKYTLGKMEAEVGRDLVQYGFGRYSGLLFSGNSEPFPMVRFSNSEAVQLPSIFSALGDMRSEFFITRMDSDQVHAGSVLSSARYAFVPAPNLELGFTYTHQFGGKGLSTTPVSFFSDYLASNSESNYGASLDARARIPNLKVDPYMELYVEDCCGNIPFNQRDVMTTFGLYFPDVILDGRVDFSVEWTRTSPIAYRHSQFSSGLYYKRHNLGHPIGSDAQATYLTLRYFASPALILKAFVAQEGFREVNVADTESEQHARFMVSGDWEVSRHLNVSSTVAYEVVSCFAAACDSTKPSHRNYMVNLGVVTNF